MGPEPTLTFARWYDRSINWDARAARELPVLTDVFGPPRRGPVLDAGCGTGRQLRELAQLGYQVVGADASKEMIDEARLVVKGLEDRAKLLVAPYASLCLHTSRAFHGVYCLGNALAASGSRRHAAEAVRQFAKCLEIGGRLFIQILNFEPMRLEQPCVRGPRTAFAEGQEYVSWRHFGFNDDHVTVTNFTIWHERNNAANDVSTSADREATAASTRHGWKMHTHSGRLYPVSHRELLEWFKQCGLKTDHVWGSYMREPFDPDHSIDLIAVATRIS